MSNVITLSRMAKIAVLSGFTMLAFAAPGLAGSTKFTTSKYPYWNVGEYNKSLSEACRRSLFNQKKIQTLNIGYAGKKGMGVTGIASREWNLYDPYGLARAERTYHFFNDGYSNCKVFVASVRR